MRRPKFVTCNFGQDGCCPSALSRVFMLKAGLQCPSAQHQVTLPKRAELRWHHGCLRLGCDGSGHIKEEFNSHYTLSGCPLAKQTSERARKILHQPRRNGRFSKSVSSNPVTDSHLHWLHRCSRTHEQARNEPYPCLRGPNQKPKQRYPLVSASLLHPLFTPASSCS